MTPPPTGPSHLSDVSDGARPVAQEHALVAWFCEDRGFGQLRLPAGDLVYVDQRDILRDGFRALAAGQHVTFVPGHDAHGEIAREVMIVETANSAIAS